jgi:glutamate dehydrogenase/leucine dehydrogenase
MFVCLIFYFIVNSGILFIINNKNSLAALPMGGGKGNPDFNPKGNPDAAFANLEAS